MPAISGFFYSLNPQGGPLEGVMSDDKTFTQEEVNELVEKEVSGLKANNAELKAEKKKLQDEQKDLAKRLESLEEAAEEAERIKAEKDGDVSKAVEQAEKKLKKELDKANEALAAKDKQLQTLLVDNGLTEALTKSGVAPHYLDAAKALFSTKHKVEITEVDGSPAALIDGKPLTEAVSEWSQGDNGKHFVAAAPNSGGNAQGANGNGRAVTGKTVTRQEWDGMDHAARGAFSRDGGKVVET